MLSDNEYDKIQGTNRFSNRFSPEEDRKLREHVRVNGKTKKSMEIIAKILERSLASVQKRCLKLLSSNEYDTIKGINTDWDYAEDEKLVHNIFKLKKIKPSNLSSLMDVKKAELRDIAPEFKRSTDALVMRWRKIIIPTIDPHLSSLASSKKLIDDVMKIIAKNYEKNTTNLRGYSEKEINFIIKQVKLKGDVPETWKYIVKQLGRKDAHSLKRFYYNHILQTPKVKGPYTPAEDNIIIQHIEEYGKSTKSFKDLTKDLGRGSHTSVKLRYSKLVSDNNFETNAKRRKWEFDENTSLIDHIFTGKQIKENDVITLENVKLSEFSAVAIKLKRSSSACYDHWMKHIVPTLKTHIKKLPLDNNWKKDVLLHIVENKVKNKNEIGIDRILMEIAPGQTSHSLLSFLNEMERTKRNDENGQSKLLLCDIASKKLREQRPDDSLFNGNHKGEQKRLKGRQDLISYYKILI